MKRRLEGHRVLITGASSGIGFAAASAFAREGADVALLARGRAGLERAAAEARAHGVAAHVIPVDLAIREQLEAAVADAVQRLGGLDVLVSNAAAVVFGTFDEVAPEDFDHTVRVSFLAAVDCIRAALPELKRTDGVIVATLSTQSKVPLPTFSSYAAAKHALRGFLGTLRIELREQRSGVRVAMVHPGPVDTPLWNSVTSATGNLPRRPPDAYSPETIAKALVERAVRPRAETTIGLEGRAIEVLFGVARPVADLVMIGVAKWYLSGNRPAEGEGSLYASINAGQANDGMHGRPSLWRLVRLPRLPVG